MLWTLLSIVVAFAELIAFMSADWLIGKAKPRGSAEPGEQGAGTPEPYHPTLGIYARCIRNPGVQHLPRETLCGPYAESFGEIASGFWQATAIFLAVGIFILCTGCCKESQVSVRGGEGALGVALGCHCVCAARPRLTALLRVRL